MSLQQIGRRELIAAIGSVAVWPTVAWAQQPKVAQIGWVTAAPAPDVNPFVDALRAGLADLGYAEGRNVMITARYADGDINSVLPLAEELAKLPVDVITTQGTATANC
jgi:putative tryptophan/tyrosine transport system substrate-binding protein